MSLAVLPNLEVLNSDRWTINMGIGLQLNHMFSISEDMDIKLYYKSKMMKSELVNRSHSSSIKAWSLSAIGELNVGYQISPLLSFGFSGGWSPSITPINVPRNGVAPRTYMNDLHFGLNINFQF